MSDGVEGIETPAVSEETQRLAELGRAGAVEHRDPLAPQLSETPRPAHIPEKFWDPVAGTVRVEEMAKSYAELEKMRGQKADTVITDEVEETAEETPEEATEEVEETPEEAPEETAEETEGDEEEEQEAPDASTEVTSAVEAAAAAYKETGEVGAEQREALNKVGISNEQIDRYIAGVKAEEAALWGAAEEAAGDMDTLQAAREWAAENWSPKKIAVFDTQAGDLETVRDAVETLMKDYRKANPSEGTLTNKTTGITHGDVYRSQAEFQADLNKALAARDDKARKAAVEKMRRSRKAGTIKNGPRRQPFGN